MVSAPVAAALAHLATVGTETGPRLQHELPFILIVRSGGANDRVTDRARIDGHVFAGGAGEAKQLAETVRRHLTSGPIATAHGVIDRAVTEVGLRSGPIPGRPIVRHLSGDGEERECALWPGRADRRETESAPVPAKGR